MNTSSLSELLHLGGHGLYVWSAYAATLGAMALEAWLVRRRLRRAGQPHRTAAGEPSP
jgi:heme exporter protein D